MPSEREILSTALPCVGVPDNPILDGIGLWTKVYHPLLFWKTMLTGTFV